MPWNDDGLVDVSDIVAVGEFWVVLSLVAGDCANATDASKAVPATPAMAYLAIMMVSLISKMMRGEHAN